MKREIIIIAVAAMFAGCSKESKVEQISATPSSISMYHDEKSEIKMSHSPVDAPAPVYMYSSSDEYVATVDGDGKVTAQHVGECSIEILAAGKSTQCTVAVKPRSTLYTEPYLTFGGTKSAVKSYEKRALASETSDLIMYKGENSNIRYVMYLFEGGKMESACVLFASKTYCVEESNKFLSERYDVRGSDGKFIMFKGKGRLIGLSYDNTLGLNALYIPATDTKNFSTSRFDEMKQMLSSAFESINQ